MSARAAEPLFIDTGAFIAWYDGDDHYHDQAKAVFQAIRSGDLPYRPLYTSRYVLSELATRLQRGIDHATAVGALWTIRSSSSFNVERVGESAFDRVCEEFERYDDQSISFVDHTSGVLCEDLEIERVFTFDPDDFHTLGFTAVPEDTSEP